MRERYPCVYIMASGRHGTINIGVTSDLMARIHQHREGLTGGFTKRYGVKRLSPGRIMETAGRLAGDSYDRVFTHDASTLGGASGSVVAHLNGADLLVVGIHFGGEMLRQNYGVTAASMENSVLQNLQVSWGV